MLSLTSEYALRSIIYLAQHVDDWPITGKRIAEHAGVPSRYLSKILGDLVRSGVLISSPGKTGGFRLRRPAEETWLHEILTPFEPFDNRRCPFGNQDCNEENPCLAHDRWKKVVESQQKFLDETSVADVAVGKRRRRQATPKKKK